MLKSGAVPTQPLSLTSREANYNSINRNKPCAQLQHCPGSPVTQDVTGLVTSRLQKSRDAYADEGG